MRRKGMNQGAFGNRLTCPAMVTGPDKRPILCDAEKWEYVEKISMFRIRYRCKVCGKSVIYDFSNRPDHPYAGFGKNKWQQIVDHWKEKNRKGMRPLG